MSTESVPGPLGERNALLAIGVGGVIAGTVDLLQACILFGWDILSALLHRALGSDCVLRRQSQIGFSEGASAGVRFVLWRGGGTGNEPCCVAALGASRAGTLHAARSDTRAGCAHGPDRVADFFQCSAVRQLSV